MRRRKFITGSVAMSAMWPVVVRAQDSSKIPRVVLAIPIGQYGASANADAWQGLVIAFLQGMQQLGYIDGKTMSFQFQSALGKNELIPEIAQKILADQPDVIVAAGGGANEFAQAFKRLTRTVPIVMANSSDPVEQGLVDSLARPGGNITGLVGNTGPEFEAKRLQLLRETSPETKRIAYLGLKVDWESPAALGVRARAEKFGVTLLHAEHTPSSYADAFAFMAREKIEGLFGARNPWNFSNRRAITEFAASHRIAAVYPTREFTEIGGLMSYGPSLTDLYRRAAGHVDKILKGTKTSDIPIEQPTKFELVVNQKTATALGLDISTLLIRADEVIE